MAAPTLVGKTFEDIAKAWYLNHDPHLILIAQNYRTKVGELDLVFEELSASGKKTLIVVEVRMRSRDSFVSGAESILGVKRRRVLRALEHFLCTYHGGASEIRLEVLQSDGEQFEVFEW